MRESMVVGAVRSLVNVWDCSLSVLESCMKHCLYLFPMYNSETMLWKERSRIKAVQMGSL